MPAFTHLHLEQDGLIRLITIDRPARLNALNRETLHELHTAFADAFDDPGTGVVVLTGAGEKAFVAGADIAEFAGFDPAAGRQLAQTGQESVFNFIENGPKPVIAAINGYALGGGLELALACHIRMAASTARLGLPEVGLGLIPGYGGTQRLTALAGKGRALELILSGNSITADEASQAGIVTRVADAAALLAEAKNLASTLLKRSPGALTAAIRAINAAGSPGGYAAEIAEFGSRFGTAEFKEGVAAFLEKREPQFRTIRPDRTDL